MNTSPLRLSLLVCAALAGSAGLVGQAAAHANPVLEQALKQDRRETVAGYQRTLLYTQLGNHYLQLGDAARAKAYFAEAE